MDMLTRNSFCIVAGVDGTLVPQSFFEDLHVPTFIVLKDRRSTRTTEGLSRHGPI
jgi:hypothetical protein